MSRMLLRKAMTATPLDLTGLKCPLPALRTRKALARMQHGERIEVRCTDPMAAIDIPHLVATMKHELVAQTRADDGSLSFLIEVKSI
jgi:tRNA 2-thiouridine synthesizing protein A